MAEAYLRGERYYVTYQENGQRYRRPLRTQDGKPVKDRKLAEYLANEIENSLSRGESPLPEVNASPKAVLELYKRHYQGLVTPKVIVVNCGSIERFLNDSNPATMEQIDQKRVRSYLDSKVNAKKFTNVTANNNIKYLKAFLNFAIDNNYLIINKLKGMTQYKVTKSPPNYLKKEEIQKVIEAAKGETLYPAIITAIYTGMRLGELRRLKWSDFNLENDTITLLLTKNGQYRTVPIHPALKELRESDLPFNFANFIRVFRRIKKRAELPGIGFHTFRHTFITHLILNGVDLPTVQKLAGHASIETTMIYMHVCQDHAKESIKKINFL